jgi:SagB-type dehydrogenase family enzyme
MHSANRVGRPNLALRSLVLVPVLGLLACAGDDAGDGFGETTEAPAPDATVVALPEPSRAGEISLEEALQQRRSGREYTAEPLTRRELGQLLWAAQGITSDEGGRTAPSAGALYPLEVFAVIGDVEGIDPGVWRYEPEDHALSPVSAGDRTAALRAASLDQSPVGDAPASIVIAGVQARTEVKYGERSERYVILEAGHAAQNLVLQATPLGLAAVTIGAFDDAELQQVVGLAADEDPLYVIPVGRPPG